MVLECPHTGWCGAIVGLQKGPGGWGVNLEDRHGRRKMFLLTDPFLLEDHTVVIGASIGIAVSPGDGDESEKLLKNADMALYRAKADGRGTWCFFRDEMAKTVEMRRTLELGGCPTKHVRNLTDVDDKTIRGARQESLSLQQFTKKNTESFHQDRKALSILPPDRISSYTLDSYLANRICT